MLDREKVEDGGLIIAPSLHINEGMKLTGHVKVEWEDVETGETGICHSKSNLIVNSGREVLVRLLKGHAENNATYHIDCIKLGTRGHTGNDVNDPLDPTATDTALLDTTSSLFTKAIASGDSNFIPNTPPHNQIDFNIVLGTGEGNAGSGARVYTEAGLFCNYTNFTGSPSNHILFARQTFESVVKTGLRRLNFTWSISWSPS